MDIVIRRQSEQIQTKSQETSDRIFYDRKWEWGFLRKQCQNLELEPFYNTYTQRLQRSYLSVFIVIQALVAVIHSVMLLAAVNDKTAIFPEIFSYLAATLLVWASLFVTFREEFIRRRQWVAYVASFVAVFILVIADLIVPLYHAAVNFPVPPLRPAYGSYILYAIYIFIPISENWHSFIFGMAVTISYLLTYVMVSYRLDDNVIIKTTTEGIFLLCVNFFGNYFRLMKEVAIRTTFLDRRECVEENLLLRYARDQEKSLLLSIIPAQTADNLERDIRERIEKIKAEQLNSSRISAVERNTMYRSVSIKKWRRPQTEKLFVKEHHNVSVLYADVVNYTYLTTQLDVKPLVETLHELFVKFDQASEDYNVLRIKFLGDCYYCVSGVPERNDHHAKSCVKLGLRMIKDIREVRNRRKLNIDMRIGVHSGSIISGVIGACKWQYDIWSKDVDIANRLESTGVAGRVHISKETLHLLDGEYIYEEGTRAAKKDEVLIKYKIETFLIKPPRFYIGDDIHRQPLGARRLIESNRISKTTVDVSAHKNFMQNTIEQYNQIRTQTKLEMSRELDKMPIGKFHLSKFCLGSQKRLTQDEMEERNFRSNVSSVLLFFKDMRWECYFLKEPDVMLKYSVLIGMLTFFGILAVQGINMPGDVFWNVNIISGTILICFIPLTWYKKLWIVFNPGSDEDSDGRGSPKNKISKFFYNLSHKIMRSVIFRTFVYLSIVIILCACSLIHLVECQKYEDEFSANYKNVTATLTLIHTKGHRLCFNPWAITESLVLTICMSFLFVRIPFLFKFFIGFIIVIFYTWVVFGKYWYIYHQSPSTNLGLDSEYSHILIVVITFVIFHLMDRQNEYIAKVDYNWKRQLQKKQEDAQFTNETINILVQNILPAHVAEIYMGRKMKDELYSEKYENVAIMFATIKNFDTEKVGLKVLNRIICDFDEILTSHIGPLKIEKIKVAGWTYMAACGLDPGRCESTLSLTGNRTLPPQRSSALHGTGRRSLHAGVPVRQKRYSLDILQTSTDNKARERKQSSKTTHNVVYVMTEFALQLMNALQVFNRENFQTGADSQVGMLRVGISHGEIMAGVVGSSKPLYDVWGNAVNMASRMDSTGIPGQIQITEETAEVLKSFNIKCDYRGLTYVKGRGQIPTYFVGIDENLNFVKAPKQSDFNHFSNNEIFSTRL